MTERGLSYWSNIDRRWCDLGDIPNKLLTGEREIIKIPSEILNEEEKEYLSVVIKPFRDRIVWIKKVDSPIQNHEYIKICYQDHNYIIVLNFPDFKAGTMYRGLELCKDYTLEELGL